MNLLKIDYLYKKKEALFMFWLRDKADMGFAPITKRVSDNSEKGLTKHWWTMRLTVVKQSKSRLIKQ